MLFAHEIRKRFEECRDTLIDFLVEYYGENNREMIVEKFNNTYFDFTSLPSANYTFAKENKEHINPDVYSSIEKIYLEYMNDVKVVHEKRDLEIKECVESVFSLGSIQLSERQKQLFMMAFLGENIGGSYVVSYGSKASEELESDRTPDSIKHNILADRKRFDKIIEFLGLDKEFFSKEKIDEFIQERSFILDEYKVHEARNTRYGEYLKREIEEKLGLEAKPELIERVANLKNGCSVSFENTGETRRGYVVKLPAAALFNNNLEGLDVIFVHEIIHRIESGENFVGIHHYGYGVQNEMANELRTQKLAIKLVRKMHQADFVVFDGDKDQELEGESTYEELNPLAGDFFERYEDVFKEVALRGNVEKLAYFFGHQWRMFSMGLNVVYSDLGEYLVEDKIVFDEKTRRKFEKAIEAMDEHYKKVVKNRV